MTENRGQRSAVRVQRQISVFPLLISGFCALLLAFCGYAQAQTAVKMPRVGVLMGSGPSSANVDAFRRGLRDLGYVDGKNIALEHRSFEGQNERIPGLIAELVQLKPDALVITALPGVRAAKQATNTIPIVILLNADPVEAGFVESLARPGGNITGFTRLTRELSGKRLELLKEALPTVSRVAVLWNANGVALDDAFNEYEAAARRMKIQLQSLEVRGPKPDLAGSFQTAAKGRASALIPITDALIQRYSKHVAELATKNGLPSMCERRDYAEMGCLMSYAAEDAEIFQRAAIYVDRILKGAKAGELPIEQPTKFELVINLKTAKQIGVTIPPHVLARADRVIR